MSKYLWVFFFAFVFYANAQDAEEFNSIYTKTYLETAQKDFEKAIEIADSLYSISETPYFKTKSLMLSASLYQQSGDIKKSIEFALKSEKLISETKDYVWISKVYGFLGSQYRMIGLFNQSKKYTDLAFENAEKIAEVEMSYSTRGMLVQEMAFREIEQNNYHKAIEYLELSTKYFEKISQNRDYLIAQNEQLMGGSYLKLKNYNSSLNYYKRALGSYGDLPDNYMKGLIYDGLARNYLRTGDLEKAKVYLTNAEKIAASSNYLELKNEVYETSQEYFLAVKDMENLASAKDKKDSVSEQIAQKKISFLDDSFDEIKQENSLFKQDLDLKNKVLIGAVLLFLLGMTYFFYEKRKQKKTIWVIKEILDKLEQNDEQRNTVVSLERNYLEESVETESVENENNVRMTSLTEEKLLQKLEEFEASELFTQNSISLSSLATYCETNTKYLSYIINTYKKQDFNNYINELRVNYIIKKLNQDTLYRKYKIATLAEEAGFSSQNKFATVFKKITTISPSLFIKYLEEDIKEISV